MQLKATFNDFYKMFNRARELNYEPSKMTWHINEEMIDMDSFVNISSIKNPSLEPVIPQVFGIRAIFYSKDIKGEMQGEQIVLRMSFLGDELRCRNGFITEHHSRLPD